VRIAVLCDVFPELSETFVVNEIAALQREGHEVRVVAVGRPRREHWPAGPRPSVTFLNELTRRQKLRAGLRLAASRPRPCLRDVRDRPSWRPAEHPRRLMALAPVVLDLEVWGVEHLHVHFAAGAALEGLRIGALLGVPVSVTAHAYDIFLAPRNLERKLTRAAFATTGCAYNVTHLRSLVDGATGARIHEIVMGVDAGAFRRTRPHPQDGRVLAVGRLVEKKGFADLVRACALLREDLAFTGLTIVGEGPLLEELQALVATCGLQGRVEFAGARAPDEVRELLEDAAVLAMPCVVAADGDRDSMPVVVKEALAMEVPVVATDEVGLPEIVDDACGRLVPPGDPQALAAALREVLQAGAPARAGLGLAGRERVLARCDVTAETHRLAGLIAAAGNRRSV
jgi:colanic acid/amylovoran biosynthesis glycosyltransferase